MNSNQHIDEEKLSDDDFASPEHNANKADYCQEIGETNQGIPLGNIRYGHSMTYSQYLSHSFFHATKYLATKQ